jgi:valyl-tRNA synthetase
MSKTRGNVVDPEELVSRYGADVLRFTLATGASLSPGVAVGPEKLEGYRAFANKLWNANRFVLLNLRPEEGRPSIVSHDLSVADRWILSAASRLSAEVNAHLETFRFDLASSALYQFTWHAFCDWYIEIAKLHLTGPAADSREGRATRGVLIEVLDTLLRLLHPFMPFVTEELWQNLPRRPGSADSISQEPFPADAPGRVAPDAESLIEEMIEVVTRVRNLRAEAGIDPGRRVDVRIGSSHADALRAAEAFRPYIPRLCQAESVRIGAAGRPDGPAIRTVAGRFDIEIPLAGVLDVPALADKLRRDLRRVASDLEARRRKLSNPSFTQRAPASVVEKERKIEQELAATHGRLSEIISGLAGG